MRRKYEIIIIPGGQQLGFISCKNRRRRTESEVQETKTNERQSLFWLSYLQLRLSSVCHVWPAVWKWDYCPQDTRGISEDQNKKDRSWVHRVSRVFKSEREAALLPHSEVEELRLLLVGPSLGQARLVQVSVRHAGLDRLGGRAVGEALGDIVVVQHRHVLQGGQGGAPGLLHLDVGDKKRWFSNWDVCQLSSKTRQLRDKGTEMHLLKQGCDKCRVYKKAPKIKI